MSEHVMAVGVDGARGGWLAALAYGDGPDGEVERVALQLVPRFAELEGLRFDGAPVGVDIPMGLPETVGARACDAEARKLLGKRASTVFAPPSRPLLAAATYADARALIEAERQATPDASGLSAQAFGLVPKIREADDFLLTNPGAQDWLWECHPELSFRALANEVLADKRSVAGQVERLALLGDRFLGMADALRAMSAGSREADLADALDALACLDSALRVRRGQTEVLGGDRDGAGLIMRMVF